MKFEEMVSRLSKPGDQIICELTAGKADALHMAIGISGEAGELLDAIKKWAIYGKPIDMQNVIEELGDLEFYMEGLRQALLIARQDTIDQNMAKLSVRYASGGYSNAEAISRNDKADER